MQKLKKSTTTRIVTLVVVVFMLILSLAFVFFSRYSGAWFTQKEEAKGVYDMGIVKLDGAENIQYNVKKLNFPASTLLRGGADDDENFNSCTFVAKVHIQNVSTVPITLNFGMDNTIITEIDSTSARVNPGLCYSMFYAKKGEGEDIIAGFEEGKYAEYFGDMSGFTAEGLDTPLPEGKHIARVVNNSLPDTIELFPTDGQLTEYDIYWIFWVDHTLLEQTVPEVQSNTYVPLDKEYGININISARQK